MFIDICVYIYLHIFIYTLFRINSMVTKISHNCKQNCYQCYKLHPNTACRFNSVQSLSHVQIFVTQWTAALQASFSITNSQSLLKLMSTELVMPSNLILCQTLLLSPSIFPSISVFSNESTLCIEWPKYWSFIVSNSPSNEYSGLISFKVD